MKVSVTVVHHEYGEIDIGDIAPRMFQDMLAQYYQRNGDWTLGDIGADWKPVEIQVDDLDPVKL